MRVAMLMSTSAGNDVMFDEALCEQGRNFCNKIWNAYRLINMWEVDNSIAQPEAAKQAIAWFDEVMMERIALINHNMEQYRISEAFTELYRLFWDDFSGWYLEMIKPAYGSPYDAATMAATKQIFENLMLLLHPFMPFVTEEIWQDLAERNEGESICVASMPKAAEADEAALARFALAQEVVSAVRNIRKQKNLAQKEALELKVVRDENYPAEYEAVIAKMANLSQVTFVEEKNPMDAAFIVKTTQYFVPMGDNIDKEAEIAKLEKDLAYQQGFLATVMKKLSNERFVSSAPAQVVANEQNKRRDAEAKIAAIEAQLAALR
jgi:valyl-tRNA synthetase